MDATIDTFSTSMGWIAVVWTDELVARVTMGHKTARSARHAAGHRARADMRLTASQRALVRRLAAFVEGQPQDFRDVQVQLDARTVFSRRVLNQCRQILWGQTASYGELAARCGSPRAARAVGRVMARNRLALIIPCHRVVGSGGTLGGFSGPSGLALKKRLLALESDALSAV